jgi:signal transduction histidine kinase
MIPAAAVLPIAATLTSVGVIGLVILRQARGAAAWALVVGSVGFALEAFAGFVVLAGPGAGPSQLAWLTAGMLAALVTLPAWLGFAAALGGQWPGSRQSRRRFVAAVAVLGLATAVAIMKRNPFEAAAPSAGPAFTLSPVGWIATLVELLLTTGVLVGLIVSIRRATARDRIRLAPLVLGLGGAFMARMIVLASVLGAGQLTAGALRTAAVAVIGANLLVAAAIGRDRLREVDLTLSRQLLYRSVVMVVLALYLAAIGGLAWLLEALAMPEPAFWGTVMVLASVLGVMTLMSADVRWRIKRFIAHNFYRSKYDYREQWIAFTKRLGSLVTVETLGQALIQGVTEAVGAIGGALYLDDTHDGRYQLCASAGAGRFVPVLTGPARLLGALRDAQTPVYAWPLAESAAAGTAAAVGLRWRDSLVGILVLGPERTGSVYTSEDAEFLSTVAEQAAGSLVTARLAETTTRTRELETFDRLTSFVVHDVKNSVAALSLLSRNALEHFGDPEFQRDTMRTLSKTVDRMTRLLARLSLPAHTATLHLERVELAALLDSVVMPPAASARIRFVREIAAGLPPIWADGEALLLVIQNLLSNAVDAVADEGTVTLAARTELPWVVLTVRDTGCGIAEEFQRRSLFAPFRSTKKGGWGIGLYHSRDIVERHHGTIAVESVLGQGTAFHVRLPAFVERGEA